MSKKEQILAIKVSNDMVEGFETMKWIRADNMQRCPTGIEIILGDKVVEVPYANITSISKRVVSEVNEQKRSNSVARRIRAQKKEGV